MQDVLKDNVQACDISYFQVLSSVVGSDLWCSALLDGCCWGNEWIPSCLLCVCSSERWQDPGVSQHLCRRWLFYSLTECVSAECSGSCSVCASFHLQQFWSLVCMWFSLSQCCWKLHLLKVSTAPFHRMHCRIHLDTLSGTQSRLYVVIPMECSQGWQFVEVIPKLMRCLIEIERWCKQGMHERWKERI